MKVVETIANNLISIANNKRNFEKLPDTFARGHDSKNRKFAVIVTFSEKEADVDELLKMYEQWSYGYGLIPFQHKGVASIPTGNTRYREVISELVHQ